MMWWLCMNHKYIEIYLMLWYIIIGASLMSLISDWYKWLVWMKWYILKCNWWITKHDNEVLAIYGLQEIVRIARSKIGSRD